MLFTRKKPRFTPQQSLSAKPVRLVEAEMLPHETGGTLKVPVSQNRWTHWLFKMPEGTTKTFEFDAMGVLVWEYCDGKTSVQQIIRKLAKRYNLTPRETEVSTRQFLHMLARKGLVGIAIREKQAAKTASASDTDDED